MPVYFSGFIDKLIVAYEKANDKLLFIEIAMTILYCVVDYEEFDWKYDSDEILYQDFYDRHEEVLKSMELKLVKKSLVKTTKHNKYDEFKYIINDNIKTDYQKWDELMQKINDI